MMVGLKVTARKSYSADKIALNYRVIERDLDSLLLFGQATKIKYLWTILQEYFPIAKEICDKRYSGLLYIPSEPKR
jgi:hypothetical protein